jgi:hypothetical protein
MTASRIPLVLAALKQNIEATPELEGLVQVVNGPPVDAIDLDVLAVGLSRDSTGAFSTIQPEGLMTQRETIMATCMILCWSGDPDLTPLQTRAFNILDWVEANLARDRRLGGVAADSRIANVTYTPALAPEGAEVVVEFRVRIDSIV